MKRFGSRTTKQWPYPFGRSRESVLGCTAGPTYRTRRGRVPRTCPGNVLGRTAGCDVGAARQHRAEQLDEHAEAVPLVARRLLSASERVERAVLHHLEG